MNKVDYLIIGAGPAGLQLAYFLQKNKRDYLILEKGNRPGAFFASMPRHGTLISINKVYTGTDDPQANLRWDWNSLLSDNPDLLFKNYSEKYFPKSEDLCRYLEDYARHYALNIRYNVRVSNVQKEAERFIVTDTQGHQYEGQKLIVATGFAQSYLPDIPGAELCETYASHNTDPNIYKNKRVMVVGKGNSAFETADNLIETAAVIHICSPEPVRFAWQTHYVGNLRAVNNNFLDTYQLKSQNAVIDATITKIEKAGDQFQVHLAYTHAKGQTAVVPYDHVIFCTGFRFDPSIFDESCRPELIIHGKFPNQTPEWESSNVPGLYFAGTLMHGCDYRRTMSGFIHGFRHNVEALSNVFESKYHGQHWPKTALPVEPQAVMEQVIKRVNTGASMFLQPGFLCDVMVIDEETDTADYYEDVRKDYVFHSDFNDNEHFYTISLEYGHFMGDPFAVERDPSEEGAEHAPYLHPIIRRYRRDQLVSEYHINDDLESQWSKEEYTRPTLAYFQKQLLPMGDLMPA